MYPVDARAMPAGVIEVPLVKKDGTYALDIDGIIAAAKRPEAKLVFICNPNNPTATPFPNAEIEKICRETKNHAAIILDETYSEFSKQDSLAAKLGAYPNLIILRTLSKSYSMAGMRMGSILCADQEFIRLARTKALDAYPLPRASISAALAVLSAALQTQARKNIALLLSERDRLIEAFKKSPLTVHVYPSDANFFLVELKDAEGFLDYCAVQHVILRDFSKKQLTENCLRISVGTSEQNDILISLLEKFGGQ
jgi:histidinol-phosphate aminotransferase